MALRALKLRTYDLIQDAVSHAVDDGWDYAHRHGAEPHQDEILQAIETALMERLAELIDFDRS